MSSEIEREREKNNFFSFFLAKSKKIPTEDGCFS